MPTGGTDRALRYELHNGGAEGVAQLTGDGFAVGVQDIVVLAGNQPRSVGLHATGCNDGRRFPGLQRIAHVHPGHLFHPHRIGGGEWIDGVHAVVRIGRTVSAAHVARVPRGGTGLRASSTGQGSRRHHAGQHGALERRGTGGARTSEAGHDEASILVYGGSTQGAEEADARR